MRSSETSRRSKSPEERALPDERAPLLTEPRPLASNKSHDAEIPSRRYTHPHMKDTGPSRSSIPGPHGKGIPAPSFWRTVLFNSRRNESCDGLPTSFIFQRCSRFERRSLGPAPLRREGPAASDDVTSNEPAAVRPERQVRRIYGTRMPSVHMPDRPYFLTVVDTEPVESYRQTNRPPDENGPTHNMTLTVQTLRRFNLKFVLPVHEIKRRFHSHKRGRLPVRRTKPRPDTVNTCVRCGS